MMPRNRVLLVLSLCALAMCDFSTILTIAPNRLVAGQPVTFWQMGGGISSAIGAGCLVLLVLSFVPLARYAEYIVLILALAVLLLLLIEVGARATVSVIFGPHGTRVSLGWGFWAIGFCLAMAIVDALQRLKAGTLARLVVFAVVIAGAAIIAFEGLFDGLSIAREYAARRDEFDAALGQHCVLVAIAVLLAVIIGAPLGLYVARQPQRSAGIFGVLNLLQTIPSVALFGILIAPLSALGIGGIGAVPAIIALVLYSLLPVVRNTEAGIAGVDRGVVDAARGMGLTPAQILWRIELPLGMPVFFAGLRIVTVQAIGLTVVAALIGAGGLGSFVFQGIGQYATDLVLLGALPTIALALAADFILALLAGFFARSRS
ncbi:MAG TPA: ABC transporter permease [Stellaceae bacterium]|nr:ABC transporter permease [Stellaceae bacterium]